MKKLKSVWYRDYEFWKMITPIIAIVVAYNITGIQQFISIEKTKRENELILIESKKNLVDLEYKKLQDRKSALTKTNDS